MENTVQIYRITYKEKVPYARPARYRSNTKLIYVDDRGEHHRYFSERLRTFKDFVLWVKSLYPEGQEFNINQKPFVRYLFTGNV